MPSVNGKCAYDSISILRSPEGPSGRVCGDKTGYATLTRVTPDQEIGLSAVMQSGAYSWNIRITMVRCDSVPLDAPRITECGLTGNTVGVSRPRSLNPDNNVTVIKKKIKRRRKTRSTGYYLRDFCSLTGLEKYCDLRGKRSNSNYHFITNYFTFKLFKINWRQVRYRHKRGRPDVLQ